MKVGAFIGKFYPPHIGHLWAIDYSLTKCDKVYVIISKNEIRNNNIKTDFDFEHLDANLIKSWFVNHYKNNSKVQVEIFDESNLRPYPLDRDIWAEKFKKQFPDVNIKIADESYREYNEKYFPEYEFLPIERDVVKIHSTDLRNDMKLNFEFLIPEAKQYFLNKLNIGEN